MKYYIEKDADGKVIAKGTIIGDTVLSVEQIELTQEEFNAIQQYIPPIEDVPVLPTEADYLINLDFRLSKLELGL